MNIAILHDKQELEAFFRENPFLHIYSLGDLDDFFWPKTIWYGLKDNQRLLSVALLYTAFSMPNLLLFSEDISHSEILLEKIIPLLPPRFYTHITPELEAVLANHYSLEFHGAFYKMALNHSQKVLEIDTSKTIRLSNEQQDEIISFYQSNYPDNWFDPRMLETQQYYGLFQDNQLISISGVHVFSPTYQVAALGNITTHLSYRGQGAGQCVTAKTCQSLIQSNIAHIGLNVSQENEIAIHCYKKLGFEVIAPYLEIQVNPL